MMNNIMLDLECLDSNTSAAIISIGAVYFDIQKQKLGPELYIELSKNAIQEQLNLGRTWSLATNIWWMQQCDVAREVWGNKNEKSENKCCLNQIKEFWQLFPEYGRNIKVWGNGSTYDNICLQNYIRTFKERIPWNYKGDLCYRTIKSLFGNRAKLERIGTHHNGLDDAKTQAAHLINMLKKENIS